MNFKKFLITAVPVVVAATLIAMAQNDADHRTGMTMVWNKNAVMTVVSQSTPSNQETNVNPTGLVTIFNNIATKYPKGRYWCCSGYNVMGPNSGAGEQWVGAAFTPAADHTVTQISVAAGYSQQGTNGIVVSLNEDNQGVPGKVLKKWNASNLPRFGTCCGLVTRSDNAGIPISGGKQYWVVLSTNRSEMDTVDGWNVADSDQVDRQPLASFTSNKWTAFQATPGVAFAVLGSN